MRHFILFQRKDVLLVGKNELGQKTIEGGGGRAAGDSQLPEIKSDAGGMRITVLAVKK